MSNEPSLRLELEQSTPARDDEKPPSASDVAVAEHFIEQQGAVLRYCEPWGSWLVWDGRRWTLNRTELMWRALQAIDAIGLPRTRSTERLAASALRLARGAPSVAVAPEDLNHNPLLFNCANGTLDLLLGELREHRREDHITRLSPVVWDREATAPRWEAFVAEITGGDVELAAYLQRVVGYVVSGRMDEEALFFLLGPAASGKSTFVRVLLDVLGDYGWPGEFEHMPSAQHVPHGVDPTKLVGLRAFAVGGFDTVRPIPAHAIERVTDGAPFVVRRPRPWSYVPTQKFVLASSLPPRFTGNPDLVARRLHTLRLVAVPEASRDRGLVEKLRAERPGILRWAALGFARWQQHGLRPPPGVVRGISRQGVEELSAEPRDFIASCCELEPDASTLAGDLLRAYRQWCAARGVVAPGWRVFAAGLRAASLRPVRGNKGVRWWRGLRLKAAS